ncbi:hypothetical protein EDB83DRAFT_1369838 [Lactarius deliciosus]|nr:hypothetical protein EDB83DRAFT_1369838 [Lactarius deliciosus]
MAGQRPGRSRALAGFGHWPFLSSLSCGLAWLPHGHHNIFSPVNLSSPLWASELCRVYSPSFSAFPRVSHSSAPLAIVERRVPDLSEAIYEVARPAKACTTGCAASSLPEPDAPSCSQKRLPGLGYHRLNPVPVPTIATALAMAMAMILCSYILSILANQNY